MQPDEAAAHLRAACDAWAPFEGIRHGTVLLQSAALRAGADALEQLQASRDQLADLEVANAELFGALRRLEWAGDKLEEAACPACLNWPNYGHEDDCWLARVLRNDPPARGRAILDQVERLREAAQGVLQGAFESSTFTRTVEVPVGLIDALRAALDLGAAPEEAGG